MKTTKPPHEASKPSGARRRATATPNQTVEHVAHEVARRIQAPSVAGSSGVERELEDPEGLLALLRACPDETLPAALGTVVVLAEVAEKNARRNLSQALMDIAASMLPRFQGLVAAGIVSMDALRWPPGPGFLA
ncbi:MAG: hypothetical protein IPK13_14730 [Deltaproteobacteria bacterium]|nr:hypothetical protein [Deltaproteobacteria bacterium]